MVACGADRYSYACRVYFMHVAAYFVYTAHSAGKGIAVQIEYSLQSKLRPQGSYLVPVTRWDKEMRFFRTSINDLLLPINAGNTYSILTVCACPFIVNDNDALQLFYCRIIKPVLFYTLSQVVI